ncbi:MAG: HDOD domain-containing protein [Pseudomonadota bacterium]
MVSNEIKIEDPQAIGEILRTLVAVIEEKDEFLRGHAERVAVTSLNFAKTIGLPQKEVEAIYFAGLLHDIGMVYIPMDILYKPGPLDGDEMVTVRQHPVIAQKILSHIRLLSDTLPIIRHHHEAYDGNGYPDGLKQDEIPIGARMLALTDQYHALISVRPHRPAFTMEKAIEVMFRQKEKFDGRLFREFLNFIQAATKAAPENAKHKLDRNAILGIAREIVDKVKREEIEIPVLPKIFKQVQDILDNPTASPDDLARAIERDAVISVRLIATANSPLYRGNTPVRTVKEAIPRLGIREVKDVVLAIASKSLYQVKNDLLKMLFEKIWQHSLACAYCAKLLAEKLNQKDAEKYFTIGLSHDIGKLMFLRFISNADFVKDVKSVSDIISYLDEINVSLSGVILRHWRLNRDFIRAITFQEGATYDKFTGKTVLILNVANHLADNIGYGIGNAPKEMSSLKAISLLNMEPDLPDKIGEEVKNIMQSVAHTF